MVQVGIKNLPILVKIPNEIYTIGIDISFYGNIENTAICIGYGRGDNFKISQIFELKNLKKLKASENYIRSLKDFYGNNILMEVQ